MRAILIILVILTTGCSSIKENHAIIPDNFVGVNEKGELRYSGAIYPKDKTMRLYAFAKPYRLTLPVCDAWGEEIGRREVYIRVVYSRPRGVNSTEEYIDYLCRAPEYKKEIKRELAKLAREEKWMIRNEYLLYPKSISVTRLIKN